MNFSAGSADVSSRCSSAAPSAPAGRHERNARSRTCSLRGPGPGRAARSRARRAGAARADRMAARVGRHGCRAGAAVRRKPRRVANSPSASVDSGPPALVASLIRAGFGNAVDGGDARELGAHGRALRRLPVALAARERRNLACSITRCRGRISDGDLGIAEPLEQAPDVAIDRLLPDALAAIEVAADQRAVDPACRSPRRRMRSSRPRRSRPRRSSPPRRAGRKQSTAASTFWTS